MRFLLYLIVFCFFFTPLHAQYINTSYADAQEIKKRILLVTFPEEDNYFLKQLTEDYPEIAYKYTDDIVGQREALRKAVLRSWKFSDSTLFVTNNEAKALMKSFPNTYALMKITEQTQDKVYMKSAYKSVLQTTG